MPEMEEHIENIKVAKFEALLSFFKNSSGHRISSLNDEGLNLGHFDIFLTRSNLQICS